MALNRNAQYTLWVIKPEPMHVGFPGFVTKVYPHPEYLWHWRTEFPDVPGTGMNVLHNLQKFLVG